VWTLLVNHLKKNNLLPVVNFIFSKKKCEEYAASLSNMDLCDAKEKSEVHVTWERALNRLKGESDARLHCSRRNSSKSSASIRVHGYQSRANTDQAPTRLYRRFLGCVSC